MREIIFRAKAINRIKGREYRTSYKNGDWVFGLLSKPYYDFNGCGFPGEMRNTDGVDGIEVDHETLGQFTGLTDRNGVKIFEGDIVQTYDPDDSPAVVRYDDRETMFAVVIDNIFYGLGEHFTKNDLTIIGNIHDNPELVGGDDHAAD